MGYVILEDEDTLQLTAEVLKRLADGWKLAGGVTCYIHPTTRVVQYVQAMVREWA